MSAHCSSSAISFKFKNDRSLSHRMEDALNTADINVPRLELQYNERCSHTSNVCSRSLVLTLESARRT